MATPLQPELVPNAFLKRVSSAVFKLLAGAARAITVSEQQICSDMAECQCLRLNSSPCRPPRLPDASVFHTCPRLLLRQRIAYLQQLHRHIVR